jgi:hypothetical protein
MRTSRPILFATAALALAAACTGDVTAPDASVPSVAPLLSTAPAEEDSVISGYGCPSTGGIDYLPFEYDPETGTEYCVTTDTTTAPPPPPPPPPPSTTSPAPAPTSPTTTPTTTPPPPPPPAPQDSVVSGYGNDPTGGIDYKEFEYDPDTRTEYVPTFDGDENDN